MSFDSFMSIKLSKCYSMFLLDLCDGLLITFLKRATIVFNVLLLVSHYCTIPVRDFEFKRRTLFLRISFSSSGSSKIKLSSFNDAIPWSDVIITFVYSYNSLVLSSLNDYFYEGYAPFNSLHKIANHIIEFFELGINFFTIWSKHVTSMIRFFNIKKS